MATAAGRGLELDRIRPYEPGDDVRKIDWNATARTHTPHVREDVPERQLTAWLLLDHSPSMHFGTADRRKADVAEGAALVVGRFAARRGNRLGIVTFGNGSDNVMPPAGGRKGMLSLLRALADEPAEEGGGVTSPARALTLVGATRTPPGVVVIASDFRGPRDWVGPLTEVAARHAVIALEITDPREESLPDVGELTLIDPETGRTLRIDTADRRLRTAFDEAATRRTDLARRRLRAPRCPPPSTFHRRAVASRARPRLHPKPRTNRTTRMNFLAPEMLLGLLLIPLAIGFYLWAQRRRSRYAVRFTNLDLLANIAPPRPSWRRHLPAALYLGAIAALLIGLARPTMVLAVPREDATVVLAIDVSGSMRASDVSPTRLDAARASAQSFIDQLPPKIRVGLVAFASQPQTLVQPTTDRVQLKKALDSLRPKDGTAMGDALMQVLDIAEAIQKDATSADASAAPATPQPSSPAASANPGASPSPSAAPGQPRRPADRRLDPALRRRELRRSGGSDRGSRSCRHARRPDLHDRARYPGRPDRRPQ